MQKQQKWNMPSHADTGPIRLTELIKQHFGVLELKSGSAQKHVLGTKQVQKNDLGLIFGVSGSKWRCASFWFRLELWVCEDLVAGRIHRFSPIQNGLSQDKFE